MRTLAAIILIAIGSIRALYLGFVAMFAVGAITSDADGVRSQIGALLVTATPFFCGAAAWHGFGALKALAGRDDRSCGTACAGGRCCVVGARFSVPGSWRLSNPAIVS